eukprot:157484-Rhodomonas_salina.3
MHRHLHAMRKAHFQSQQGEKLGATSSRVSSSQVSPGGAHASSVKEDLTLVPRSGYSGIDSLKLELHAAKEQKLVLQELWASESMQESIERGDLRKEIYRSQGMLSRQDEFIEELRMELTKCNSQNQALQDENFRLREERTDLSNERKMLSAKLLEAEKQRSTVVKGHGSLERERDIAMGDCVRLREEVLQRLTRQNDLDTAVLKEKAAVAALRRDVETQSLAMAEWIQDVDTMTGHVSNTIQKLKSKIQVLESSRSQMLFRGEQTRRIVANGQARNKALEETLNHSHERVVQMELEVTEMQRQVAALEKEVAAKTNSNTELAGETGEYAAKAADLYRHLQAANAATNEERGLRKEAEKQCASLAEASRQKGQAIADLESRIVEFERILLRLQDDLSTSETKQTEMTIFLKTEETQRATSERQLHRAIEGGQRIHDAVCRPR